MRITRLVGVTAACLVITTACGLQQRFVLGRLDGRRRAPSATATVTGKAGQYELDTVKDGVLTIKADVPSVGWWDGDTVDDIKSGYEYCMAAEIAQRSGLKSIDLQYVSFDGLVSGKLTGYDLSLDEISITPERQQVVDFSDPYYTSSIGVLAKKGADVSASRTWRACGSASSRARPASSGSTDTLHPESSTSSPATPRRSRRSTPAGSTPTCRTSRSSSGRPSSPAARSRWSASSRPTRPTARCCPRTRGTPTTINKIIADLDKDGTLDKLSKTYLGPAFGGDPEAVPTWSAP